MPPATPHNAVEVSPVAPAERTNPASLASVRDAFRALTSTCGVYPLSSRAKIRLTGSDRVRWLNGMVTNNVRDLQAGHGVYAFLLNPQGHILGDLYAYQRGEDVLVDTDQSQREKILATFDHYIIMDDVDVTDVSDALTAIGVAGPNAGAVLHAAGLQAPDLGHLQIANLEWHQIAVSIVRGERSDYPSYEIWIAPDAAKKMIDALLDSAATLADPAALELYRIALGLPRYGPDIRERDLPQETEQARALNFNKGCYIGQEIVERIRSRGNVHRKFTGFLVSGPPPSPGTKIQVEAKDVGEITSSASIPTTQGDRAVALGYIRRELAIPGKEVPIAGSTAIVTEPPFVDLFRA
jgi:folate-binding protein YgfZ